MSTMPQSTCPTCGNEFSGAMEFCPVCMLRKGLAGGVESGEFSAPEEPVSPTPEHAVQRFEHYELVTGEDGKPVELAIVPNLPSVVVRFIMMKAEREPGMLDHIR
jgi:hypothetical protein